MSQETSGEEMASGNDRETLPLSVEEIEGGDNLGGGEGGPPGPLVLPASRLLQTAPLCMVISCLICHFGVGRLKPGS